MKGYGALGRSHTWGRPKFFDFIFLTNHVAVIYYGGEPTNPILTMKKSVIITVTTGGRHYHIRRAESGKITIAVYTVETPGGKAALEGEAPFTAKDVRALVADVLK